MTSQTIDEHLGSGQFGSVEKGVWTSPDGPVDVAIKTLNNEASEVEKVNSRIWDSTTQLLFYRGTIFLRFVEFMHFASTTFCVFCLLC